MLKVSTVNSGNMGEYRFARSRHKFGEYGRVPLHAKLHLHQAATHGAAGQADDLKPHFPCAALSQTRGQPLAGRAWPSSTRNLYLKASFTAAFAAESSGPSEANTEVHLFGSALRRQLSATILSCKASEGKAITLGELLARRWRRELL